MQQDKIRKKRKLMDGLFYASFMIIPLTAFLVFYLYVNIDSFIMAFQQPNGKGDGLKFAGFENFVWVFKELKNPDPNNLSDNTEKITNPGFKTFYRIYDNATGKAEADLIALRGEKIDFSKPLTLYHPIERWKKITFENYTARELPVAIIKGGKLVYDLPKLKDIRAYAAKEMDSFWDEYKRLDQPHVYKVDLSDELYALKTDMLDRVRRGENV